MLVEITESGHDVVLDIVYATERNFTGTPVYRRPACYLHPDAAAALARAVALAKPLGLRLKIFDGFRPSEAQRRFWKLLPDPVYVADPRRGSTHSRGIAVDVTLMDEHGAELDMGTGFDAFTPLSHHAHTGISVAAQRNRLTLLGLMTASGWNFRASEWWHYQLFLPSRYKLLSDSALPEPLAL